MDDTDSSEKCILWS